MATAVRTAHRRKSIMSEIERLKAELAELELSESELKNSLVDAKKQLSYYRNLISTMKRAVSPSRLKKVIRLL